VVQALSDFIDKSKVKDFAAAADLVRRCARLLSDPQAGLKAKDNGDRYLTAAMLVFRYRTPVSVYTGKPKSEPVDAKESSLILAALAEADWTEKGIPPPMAPQRLFLRLGLTADDDWSAPQSVKEITSSAKTWLSRNKAAYRIQRFLPEEPQKE